MPQIFITFNPFQFRFHDIDNILLKLLQSLKLFIGEPDEDYEGGVHELSLGGANRIFLTLKLLEFKYRKLRETFANFLVIEEPESHIHNHIQKTLFDKLDYGDTQIIYSTHSTQISEVSNVENSIFWQKNQIMFLILMIVMVIIMQKNYYMY
jgi:predicted ATP-dependent endonuclease of OLD family